MFHRIDSLNEEIGHAAVPVFELGVERIGKVGIKKTRQCTCSKAEARRVYWLQSITFQKVWGEQRYLCILLRFSTFQSASGFAAAALAIVSSGKISSGR